MSIVYKIGLMSRSKRRVSIERSNHKEYPCVQLQGQGSKVKITGTHGEFLSHKILS